MQRTEVITGVVNSASGKAQERSGISIYTFLASLSYSVGVFSIAMIAFVVVKNRFKYI
jgi:hypothetical protein